MSSLACSTIKSIADNDAITITSDGVASFSNIPLLSVHRSSGTGNQTVTNNVNTKVQFDTVAIDTDSWWDAANYRYVPQIPGYYRFDYSVGLNGTSVTILQSSLQKNGVTQNFGVRLLGTLSTTSAGMNADSSILVFMNGTTDYVEVFGQVNAASGTSFYGSLASTYLQAQLIQRTASGGGGGGY